MKTRITLLGQVCPQYFEDLTVTARAVKKKTDQTKSQPIWLRQHDRSEQKLSITLPFQRVCQTQI